MEYQQVEPTTENKIKESKHVMSLDESLKKIKEKKRKAQQQLGKSKLEIEKDKKRKQKKKKKEKERANNDSDGIQDNNSSEEDEGQEKQPTKKVQLEPVAKRFISSDDEILLSGGSSHSNSD